MKKARLTTEKLKNQLESLYILLKIAPDYKQIEKMIKEKEKELQKRLKIKKIV